MKCKYCNAEFDIQLNVCPMCGRPTESYRGGMRKNTVSVNQRDDYIFTKNSDVSRGHSDKKIEKTSHKEKEEIFEDVVEKEQKVNPVYDDSIFIEDEEFETEQKHGNKKKIIILCSIIIILVCVALFGCFKLGLFDKKDVNTNNEPEKTTADIIIDDITDVTNTNEEKTTANKTELAQGYYVVKRDNGASMYSTNITKDSTPVCIASKGSYVEIKSFFIDGNTVLGFAVTNNRYGWLEMDYVEYVGEKLPETATKENTTAPTTQAPVQTPAPQNSNNETQDQGTYTVNNGVADTENGNLNVRSEASSETDNIVAVLNPGDEVTVVEWDGNWAKIEYQGSVLGYVYGSYLDKN